MFGTLIQYLLNLIAASANAIISALRSGCEQLWRLGFDLMAQLRAEIVHLLPSEAADKLNIVWDGVASALSAISYFFPIYSALAMFTAALGAAVLIRALRWVKSFVPTIGD